MLDQKICERQIQAFTILSVFQILILLNCVRMCSFEAEWSLEALLLRVLSVSGICDLRDKPTPSSVRSTKAIAKEIIMKTKHRREFLSQQWEQLTKIDTRRKDWKFGCNDADNRGIDCRLDEIDTHIDEYTHTYILP